MQADLQYASDVQSARGFTVNRHTEPRYGVGIFTLLWMAGSIDAALLAAALYISCLKAWFWRLPLTTDPSAPLCTWTGSFCMTLYPRSVPGLGCWLQAADVEWVRGSHPSVSEPIQHFEYEVGLVANRIYNAGPST